MNQIRTRVIIAVVIFLALSCASEQFLVEVEPSGTRVVKGAFHRSDLEHDSSFTWYRSFYDSYEIERTTLKEIGALSKDVHFILVLGTWCGDSKRQVPHMLKIFDSAKVSERQFVLFGVDRSKKSQDGFTDQYHIDRVPTLIVLKGDQELGRIVEVPTETLEKDMLRILQKQ